MLVASAVCGAPLGPETQQGSFVSVLAEVAIGGGGLPEYVQERYVYTVVVIVYGAYGARQEHHGALFPMMRTG